MHITGSFGMVAWFVRRESRCVVSACCFKSVHIKKRIFKVKQKALLIRVEPKFFALILFKEDCLVTHCEDVEYNEGKYISYIATNPFGEFQTVASVSFFNEVIPAPTITASAECQVNQAAQGEKVVTYDKVFKVKYAGAFTHRLEVAPDVEAKYAR